MEIVKYMDNTLACFSRVRLASREQVMVSIATSSVKVLRMAFGGIVPVETLWESADWVQMGLMFRCGHEDRSAILDAATGVVLLSPTATAVKDTLARMDEETRGWR